MTYFGSSIGIAVRGDNLEVVCLRGRWKRVAVTGFLRIENYRTRPVAEVAEQYRRFCKANHVTTSATVALPREAALLRLLELPAEVLPNLAQTVAYQVDTLHPFEEGSVYFDHALLPAVISSDGAASDTKPNGSPKQGLRVAVALAEKSRLDEFYDWCCRAGIDVAAFTFSTAAVYQAFRKPSTAPASDALSDAHGIRGRAAPLIVLDRRGQSVEIIGLGADGSFYSRECEATGPLEREIDFCVADLRWSGEESPGLVWVGEGDERQADRPGLRLEEGLLTLIPELPPTGKSEFRLKESFAAYATALLALDRRLPFMPRRPGLDWNLLPVEKRIYRSHWAYASAYALAAAAMLLVVAWAAVGFVQDRFYASRLDAQIRALAPRVHKLEKLDESQKATLRKLEILERHQQDISAKMDGLEELTRLLPNSAWLQSLDLTEKQLIISGQADAAGALLTAISQSSHFEQPQFLSAVAKNAEGRETFQIKMRVREMPLAAAVAALPAPAAGAPAPPLPAATPPSLTSGGAGAAPPNSAAAAARGGK